MLLALFLVWAAPAGAAVRADSNAWTSYGFDNQLTNGIETRALTGGGVAKMRLDWSVALDGPVFASPLSANVLGQQLVFAATEAGSVYAVDAQTGTIVWERNLGTVETPQCGTWGITSTGGTGPPCAPSCFRN